MFGYSGITRYFYEVISRLSSEAGISISPFLGWNTTDFKFERNRNNYAHYFGVRRPNVPKTTRIFNTLNDMMFPLFLSLSRSELYHQTYYRYLAPRFKGRRVLTVYDMTYELFPEKFSQNDPSILQKRKSIECADALIAISESTRRDMVRLLGIPSQRISVIYLANSLTAAPRLGPPIDGPYILFVGQRVPHKNFMRLLTSYCQSPRLHGSFTLVCFGGAPVTDEERSVLARHGCEGRMQWRTGDDGTLASCYGSASLLVYPSLYEGFGMPLIEAMHYGCPVVASNAGSLPEVGGDACLYFDPFNAQELAEKMELVLFDDGLRSAMIERGLARERAFSWERCAVQTRNVYASLL
jgi:glycosyltransferase involved in cell wall biosynthesis